MKRILVVVALLALIITGWILWPKPAADDPTAINAVRTFTWWDTPVWDPTTRREWEKISPIIQHKAAVFQGTVVPLRVFYIHHPRYPEIVVSVEILYHEKPRSPWLKPIE
ncbi:MAG: hypothetical protein WC683_04570 [bacterium]